MSLWAQHDMQAKVEEALATVPETAHPLGRPYLTAYQVAIKLCELYPTIGDELNKKLGGEGVGVRTSLSQYVATQLAAQVGPSVDGARIAHFRLKELIYAAPNGEPVRSSLISSGDDLSMFRLRP